MTFTGLLGRLTMLYAGADLGAAWKYALPLLEHLDQHVTRRQGDQRVLLRDPGRV